MTHHRSKLLLAAFQFFPPLFSGGLPMKHWFSWKQFYLDDLRLKKNWMKGRCAAKDLEGHKKKCVENQCCFYHFPSLWFVE